MRRVNLAIWEADGTTQVSCNKYVYTDDDVVSAALGLTIGNWYYISVDNNYSSYRGTFTLCLSTTLDYDFYEGAKDVSAYINACSPDAAYTTIGATMDKSQGSCNNGSGYNRWFKFQATATNMEVTIDRGGSKGTMRRVNLAIWEADGTTQVSCNKYVNTDDDVVSAALGLTIGNWYYISVDNNYSSYRGTFTLCLSTALDYDYYEGAITISSLHNACSVDAEYTTVGATMDKSQGSCNNGSGYNRWFKFQALEASVSITVKRGGSFGTVRRVNTTLWQSDGSTQLACNRYSNTNDNVNMTYDYLTVGDWYYISVDNNYSSYRGTFTICIDNVADTFYSRADGNWGSTNSWSYASHSGVAASNTPRFSDVVYIDGHTISANSSQSCATAYVTVANGASTLNVNGSILTVNGDLSLINNGFNNKASLTLSNSGDVNVNNDLILEKNGGNQEVEFTASLNSIINITRDVYLTSNSGTGNDNNITFYNAADMTIGRDFLISHTAGVKSQVTLNNSSNITINGDLEFSATTNNKVEVVLNTTSSITFNGTIVRGLPAYGNILSGDNSTLNFNGIESGQNIPSTAASGTTDVLTFKNVVINTNNSTDELSINTNINISGNLTLTNGKLSIPNGKVVTVDGNIINNTTITIENGGSLLQTKSGSNENSGSGTYLVNRTGNGSNMSYNIWSSPIQNANLTSVFSGSNACDIWAFDATSQSWSHDFAIGYAATCNGNAVTFTASDVIAGGDGIMDAGRGYFVPGATISSKQFNGEVNNGNISFPIKTTNLGNQAQWDDDDWNLVGNPYPSGLDAAAFWTENAINNSRITDAIYFWDDNNTGTGYNQNQDYGSWNALGGVNSGNSATIPNGTIGSGQGFWVVGNSNTNLIFNNSMRTGTNDQFFKTSQASNKHLAWVSVTTPSGYNNNILVGYSNNTTDTIDPLYDAHKLAGNAHVRFASLIGTDEFAIQGVKQLNIGEYKTIPLVVFTDATGDHKFSNYKTENLPTGFKIYFRDILLNITHDLSKGDYVVNLTGGQDYLNRFELVFENTIISNNGGNGSKGSGTKSDTNSNVTSVNNEFIENQFTLANTPNGYTLSNQNGLRGEVIVLDVTGKIIWTSQKLNGSHSVAIDLENASSGLYILELRNGSERLYQNKILKY